MSTTKFTVGNCATVVWLQHSVRNNVGYLFSAAVSKACVYCTHVQVLCSHNTMLTITPQYKVINNVLIKTIQYCHLWEAALYTCAVEILKNIKTLVLLR